MKFLVASMRHELLPLAHRLRREGHEVETLVWRARYERAWAGSIEKIARHSDGTIMASSLRGQIEAAGRGELTVLTTVARVAELFHAGPQLYAWMPTDSKVKDRCLLGGWFDGEAIQAPHLLVADWGAWTGGAGPHVLGGLTLVRLGDGDLPGFVTGAVQDACDRMKSASFRGLFHFDVEEDVGSGEYRLQGLAAGWPWLHTQVWMAELESFSAPTLGGIPNLRHKYVSGVPISIPPWPNEKRSKTEEGVEIHGLTPQQQGQLFWFDIEVDPQARLLKTAGLDGLLAVAIGSSDSTPALARARALALAHRLQVPEKQFRGDVGIEVDAVLSTLEDRYGFVV